MIYNINILLIIKYVICAVMVLAVVLAPAYLARINKKNKLDMVIVRASSWLFGWTGVGWLYALYLAVKK